MSTFYSPLRYPGGKAKLSTFLAEIIRSNELQGGTYVEAYAGGSGAALKLLFSNIVDKIVLNDLDEFVSSFWLSACKNTDELISLIHDTKITIDTYNRLKYNLSIPKELSTIEKGFTCFFLNRCNRSGILTAGPIGGKNQTGNWKLDARFNKSDLIERIKLIGLNKNKIEVYNLDSISFLENYFAHLPLENSKILIYLDPPYYKKGNDLYRLAYSDEHHKNLAKFIKNQNNYKWVLSYDDSQFIKNLYDDQRLEFLAMNYFASKVKIGEEVIFCSRNCVMPEKFINNSKYIFTPIKQKEFLKAFCSI
ncbi:MAG: DNA adenine methylase [Bacteroidetes bacterium]|nr:MAG: DNA adenine methylase [Bacteroidota bacterium]